MTGLGLLNAPTRQASVLSTVGALSPAEFAAHLDRPSHAAIDRVRSVGPHLLAIHPETPRAIAVIPVLAGHKAAALTYEATQPMRWPPFEAVYAHTRMGQLPVRLVPAASPLSLAIARRLLLEGHSVVATAQGLATTMPQGESGYAPALGVGRGLLYLSRLLGLPIGIVTLTYAARHGLRIRFRYRPWTAKTLGEWSAAQELARDIEEAHVQAILEARVPRSNGTR